MSLERLLEKIEGDARREAGDLLAQAKEQAAGIKKRGEEEAKRAYDAILESFRDKAGKERMKILSAARMEGRLRLLAVKDEILESTFEAALRAVEECPPGRYRAWLKGVVQRSVGSGSEEIIPATFDLQLLRDGLLEEINGALEEQGKRGELRLSAEVAPVRRGVILKDGKIVTNLSVESLLREVRDRHEEEVLKILFEEEGR
jgi:V/A-type H+-transporting ATPase subunit E